MLNIAEMMHSQGLEVKILAMETHKHSAPERGYPSEFKKIFAPESVFVETKVKILNALSNLLFSKESYHLLRFKNKNFEQKLFSILKEYKPDVVVLDSLFTSGYIDVIKINSKAKIIYRAHNIEYIIWQEIAAKTKSFFKKYYLEIQSSRLKNEELIAIAKCDGILAITGKDADFFSKHVKHKKIMTLPFTVNISEYNVEKNHHEKSLFFIGAMDWYPNLEGVKWFIDIVWNEVLKKHPTAKFYLAGKAMPDRLKNLEHINIINLGEVPNAKEFMQKAPLMIAPIFSGGGLKIKMIEAMAMGKIVVCNPQAAFGIPVTHQKDVLFAHSSTEFIALINEQFSTSKLPNNIGENARALIVSHFNTVSKSNELALFLRSLN